MKEIMKYHPLANIFPLVQGREYESLVEAIRKDGQILPIFLHPEDGSIIDGRNRYRACLDIGIEPRYETWSGEGSLISFIVNLNLTRRHLTTGERVKLVVELVTLFEEEAKQRQLQGKKIDLMANLPEGQKGLSRDKAAEVVGFSPRTAQDATKVKKQGTDELFQAVTDNKVAVSTAATIAELPKREQKELLENFDETIIRQKAKELNAAKKAENRKQAKELEQANVDPLSGKYRIVYCDPPWQYSNSGMDDYGHAERHYPTMSIQELCAMPVKECLEENAVIFMWVPSPMLDVSFQVLDAWGVKYKALIVWDKEIKMFGNYVGVCQECLLIAARGSCTRDTDELIDSVVTIRRSSKHSQKPERFREIIDTLYTYGNRIELFAREPAHGWKTWGNQCQEDSNKTDTAA